MSKITTSKVTTSKITRIQQIKLIVGGMLLGGVIVFILSNLSPVFSDDKNSDDKNSAVVANEKKPLYWVAPMDANYRRDKPGKSPMGMDLTPVYENTGISDDDGPGTIKISPQVINNLGVRTAQARYSILQNTINTVGYVTFNEDKLVHIHSRVQGWVEKLYVKANGDPIEQNQPLYDLYSPELVNAQEEFLLALDRNNRQLLDAAYSRLRALKFSITNIEKLKNEKKVQQLVTFYAPQQGVVKQLDIREGFYVKPETLMLSLVDLSSVWVKAEVFEKQNTLVAMGDKVDMHLDYLPNTTWQGTVEHIHPMINTKTRTAIARLRFDNPKGLLKPNMFANITIHTKADNNALLIPKEALIRTGNQNRVVLALGDGRFKSIAVIVGRFDNDKVEIIKGLIDGDMVVSSAQFLLDSESSKSSDFERMASETLQTEHVEQARVEKTDVEKARVSSATVNGTVVTVMPDQRLVIIDREAIEKWGRAANRVEFMLEETVDINLFSTGAYVMFTFEIRDGNFIIVSAMAMPMPESESEPKSMIMPKLDTPNTNTNISTHSHAVIQSTGKGG